MTKELFQRYAEIKSQTKVLEAEAEVINEKIVAEMEAEKADKVESDYGQFYFTTRKAYKYSPSVDEIATKLKETKKAEEESGVAVATESKSLTFKAK